jgi:dihydrofolate reductase
MTRWAEKDLTGQLVRQMARDPKADQWEVVEFPMELPSGDPVWPEYWSLDDLNGGQGIYSAGQVECAVSAAAYGRYERNLEAGVVADLGKGQGAEA